MFKSMLLRLAVVGILSLFVPAALYAAGKHEGLNCTGCHGIHTAQGDIIFAVAPNKKVKNPRTKKPYTGITSLCLGCHETIENGGMGIIPVSPSHSHPFGVKPNPKVASVPKAFLRDGKLECVGCHDPHPSNPNYKYLRVDTKGGADMQKFCVVCHSTKGDVDVSKVEVFNSMDERKPSLTSPLVEKPVKKSNKKRK